MVKIIGARNTAVCYTGELEPAAEAQTKTVCDRAEYADCKIRIMPDVHAGKGCTIGTTMTIADKIVPGMVGVDIGCGMETVKIEEEEWNQSAPHGAGRLMSRTAAFKTLSMGEYVSKMSGVFTTSVNRDTLDESPMAYKPIDDIISHIAPTADIIERVRPAYNFKASE